MRVSIISKKNIMLHVFDLDDTLVYYGRKRIVVPRQTFHFLRALRLADCRLAIVSHNPLAPLVAASLGLRVDTLACGKEDRVSLMKKVLTGNEREVHYYDDRLDNLEAVAHAFPDVVLHHVRSPLLLFHCKRTALLAPGKDSHDRQISNIATLARTSAWTHRSVTGSFSPEKYSD